MKQHLAPNLSMQQLITLNSAKPAYRHICASPVAKRCPQRQGTGVFDPIRLEVYIGAATKVLETKDHNFENGHKLEWIHEKAEFKGVTINTDTQFHIRPVEEYWGVAGAHRYYLDNIKISYKKNGTSGIDDITVNEENAPVEYYNLQGVRVENPENGIFIRRQGNNITKCVK